MSTEPNNKESIEDYFRKNKESVIGIGLILGVAVGLALGAAIGVFTDNIGFGPGVGMTFGAGVGLVIGLLLYARLSADETE